MYYLQALDTVGRQFHDWYETFELTVGNLNQPHSNLNSKNKMILALEKRTFDLINLQRFMQSGVLFDRETSFSILKIEKKLKKLVWE